MSASAGEGAAGQGQGASAAAATRLTALATEVSALEHTTLKHPYECVRRAVKASAAALEAGLRDVQADLEAAEALPLAGRLRAARDARARLERLQGQVSRCKAQEGEAARLCDVRLAHLQQAALAEAQPADSAWREQRVTRVVVDHMLRQGCYRSAALLAEEAGVTDLVNVALFREYLEMEDALQHRRDCAPALAWCEANADRLQRLKSTLRFRLQLQQFVELVRRGQRAEAVAFAHATFPAYAERHLGDIQTVMSLLVFTADTSCERYLHFFHEDRWSDLVRLFRNNTFALNSLPGQSTLTFSMQAGLAVLKSPQCFEEGGANPHCPVCSEELNPLAAPLPHSNQIHSTLVCRISGALMNEDNPPTMLPNGYVYSLDALVAMWQRKGRITCPRTGSTYSIDDLQKVFVI